MICTGIHPDPLSGKKNRRSIMPRTHAVLPSRWLSTEAAAAYLGVSPSTLCNDRVTRSLNIPFTRLGRRVLYDRQELDAYLLARMEGVRRREDA